MNIIKNIYLLPIILVILLSSCGIKEERPNYNIINNTIPASDLRILWNNNGFVNQENIVNSLNSHDQEIFLQSLSWISTESNINLVLLHEKSAKELVDIANCLKSSKDERKCIK